MDTLVSVLIWTTGAGASLLANFIYYDMRRKGVRGFGRFIAFCAGNPTTWITMFLVREGQVATFHPPPDDDEGLLREVRMDRELRGLPPFREGSQAPRDGETRGTS